MCFVMLDCIYPAKGGKIRTQRYSRVFEVQELLLLEDITPRRISVCRELECSGIEYSVDLAERRI